ncbi:hypothetical protein FISHEDRAFT_69995 [Fistulina hepatica ATCC 64428]|uniref:F-box domain-containing protein n=1 Tax=Fistulina hepatica ATCC 64428 TaxID=1128425 RepID=A0A0D7AL78_9AGAR|nr:hypothetical protein FISHEDRAFT_69995 [Fistulina hepatica ATCC 64428]
MSFQHFGTPYPEKESLNTQVSVISAVVEPPDELLEALDCLSLPVSLLSGLPGLKRSDILYGFGQEVWTLFTCQDRDFSVSLGQLLTVEHVTVGDVVDLTLNLQYTLFHLWIRFGALTKGESTFLFLHAKMMAHLMQQNTYSSAKQSFSPVGPFKVTAVHLHMKQVGLVIKLYRNAVDSVLELASAQKVLRIVLEVEIEWIKHSGHVERSFGDTISTSARPMALASRERERRHANRAHTDSTHKKQVNFQSALTPTMHISELLLHICQTLDIGSVCSLRATCRLLYDRLSSLLADRMMRLLKRVFQTQKDVHEFAKLLRASGAIVGGSTALAVLCPNGWQPGDLDIILHEGHESMVLRFLERCGFKHENDKDKQDLSQSYTHSIRSGLVVLPRFEYKYYSSPREGAPGIDLSVVCVERPAEFIMSYHSTIVMNFWNGHHLYCLWPRYTFAGQFLQNYVTTNTSTKTEDAIQKYRDRGYCDVVDETGRKQSVQGLCYPIWANPNPQGSELELGWIPKPLWRQPLRLESVVDIDMETSMASLHLSTDYQIWEFAKAMISK